MADNLNTGDLVVTKVSPKGQTVSARVLRVFGQEAPGLVQIRVNGLDTKDPLWGEAFIVKAEWCEKSDY